MLGTLGGLAGAGLGHLGGLLSLPRRGLLAAVNAISPVALPEEGSEFTRQVGGDPESLWGKALGFGYETLTDPLTFFGGAIGSGVSKVLGKSAIPALLKNRRQFGAVKGMVPAAEGLWDGRVVGKVTENSDELLRGLGAASEGFNTGRIRGAYAPRSDMAFLPHGASRQTARHELSHGIMDQAAKSGDYAGLPLGMQATAGMRQSGSPFVRGLSEIADEAVAHGVDGGWRKSLNFLTSGNPGYVDQFNQVSPLAASLYGSIPSAIKAGKVGGMFGAPIAAGVYYGMQD